MSIILGVGLGLFAGCRGRVDSVIMRIADIQLTFPAILVALLINGIGRQFVPREMQDALALT